MTRTTIEADSVGPAVELADITMPALIEERFQRLFGTDEPIETGADWMVHTERAIETKRERGVTVDDLCTTEDGDHAFEASDSAFYQEYMCVLDPIAYAFITDTPGTVHTVTAERRTPIEIDIDADGITVDRDGALTSIGVSDHVEYVGDVTPETIYQQVCGYIQTFADEEEYEEWATSVDAATTPLPLETGIGAAGRIAETLFEDHDSRGT